MSRNLQRPSHLTQTNSVLHDRVVAHVTQAFESTAPENGPFRHAFVYDVFPEDIYARVLQKLPLISVLERLSQDDGKDSRAFRPLKVQLVAQTLQQLPDDQARFWSTICKALRSVEVSDVVYRKMQDGLSGRLRAAIDRHRNLSAVSELVCERDRDCVAPTSGDSQTAIGLQFSLAHDSDLLHLGTEFFERSWSPRSWWRNPKGFRIVSSAPFLPNTAFVFVVRNGWLRKTWLGRSMRSTTNRPRFSLLIQWQVPQKADRLSATADSDALALPSAETSPNIGLIANSTLIESDDVDQRHEG